MVDDITDNTALASTAGLNDNNTGAAVASNVTTTDELIFLNATNIGTLAAANLDDVSAVATALEIQVTLTAATGDDALLVLESSDTAGKFGVYYYSETGAAANTFNDVDLTVLGIVTGNDIVAADIATT